LLAVPAVLVVPGVPVASGVPAMGEVPVLLGVPVLPVVPAVAVEPVASGAPELLVGLEGSGPPELFGAPEPLAEVICRSYAAEEVPGCCPVAAGPCGNLGEIPNLRKLQERPSRSNMFRCGRLFCEKDAISVESSGGIGGLRTPCGMGPAPGGLRGFGVSPKFWRLPSAGHAKQRGSGPCEAARQRSNVR